MSKIILNHGQGEIIEKKSRFICDLFPIYQEKEIEEYIQSIKKEHYSARHHCYAWVFREQKRCQDDGEPSGSAGMPMLNVLEKEDFHNVLAVVTRYFGGTLLGVGGLTRAYSGAVQEAVKNITSYHLEEGYRYRIKLDYSNLGSLEHLIEKKDGLYRIQVGYDEKVDYEFMVHQSQVDMVETFLNEMLGGSKDYFKSELEKYIIDGVQVRRDPSWD